MVTDTHVTVCKDCLLNIEDEYEKHIWYETCFQNGMRKRCLTVYLDDEKFEAYLQNLEKKNFIKYANLQKNKVIIKSKGEHYKKDKIIYCVSPMEHLENE